MARSEPNRRRRRSRKPTLPLRRITLTITDIGVRGDGVGVDGEQKFHVPLTAPGDVVLAEVSGERGRVLEITKAGPGRIAPPCSHYGVCGGCALQHLTVDFYAEWKRGSIARALARAGLAQAPVAEMVSLPMASRRRATFAVKRTQSGAVFGFNARHSSKVVGIDHCPVLAPALDAALPGLRELARAIPAGSFDLAVTLCRNGLDINLVGKGIEEPRGAGFAVLSESLKVAGGVRLSLDGEPLVTLSPPMVDFAGVSVTPPPGGFLQASKEGEAALLSLVQDAVSGARKVCDLFCGSGSFTLPLAKAASVFAADGDGEAIAALMAAAANAQSSGLAINPVRAERRDLFERPLQVDELNDFQAVVFDPPRAGARMQAEELAKSKVPVIVGVSCNPATFARDAAILSQGGYVLEKVTPVDQFVYAPHIELVAVFRRT